MAVGVKSFFVKPFCILIDKQSSKWYAKENIDVEVVDVSKAKYPNRDALRDANDIYLDYMRPFVIHHLKQVPGENVENLIAEALDDRQADDFWRKLDEDNDIESAIDFSYFPLIIKENWLIKQNRRNYGFAQRFDGDMTVQSRLWLIREGRNACEHRPAKDLDREFVQTHLFLIAEVLSKINRPDQQHEVETIRNKLDNTKEHLAEAKERLKSVEAENAEYRESLEKSKKDLETAESKKIEYKQENERLSEEEDKKEKRLKKLSRQLKNARAENEKNKKNLSGAKQRLEESEAAQADYKERLKTISEELKVTKEEARTLEENLKTTSNQLKEALDEWMASMESLTATRNLFTAATIGSQEIQKIFPSFETDSAVRVLDRRNTEKKNYLLNLLEQKQPTLIYVQSEEMVETLLDHIVPEKADFIEKHGEQTSEAEEMEILEKLDGGELIAVVSDTTFSTLKLSHCVEHFVLCHLVPSSEAFFDRCQPAFTSANNAYLHLIYNSEQDMDRLVQKYPDRDVLEKMYPELRKLAETNGNFIQIENLYSKLDIAKLGIETGLAIFEDLQLIERTGNGIKLLPPAGKKLDESDIYRRGEELKKETADFHAFQREHSIEQIWEKMLEKLSIDDKQILRESNIHKMPLRISETEGDYLKDSQTQPEQSTTVVEKDNAASDETATHHTTKPSRANAKVTEEQVPLREIRREVPKSTKPQSRKKKLSIAERYVAETTVEERDGIAAKVIELRINATGSKPLAWKKIREKLDLRNDQFHKVIRHSEGYRKAVIQRIKFLKAQEGGWEYNGKLEVLTGIELTEKELE